MLQMLYVSGSSKPMAVDDIQKILAVSRRNNLRDGITGMLLWADGVFIQILEGEADTVRSAFRRIESDDRHRNIMVVLEQTAEKRLFNQWSMGFKQLDADMAADKKLFQISRAALVDRITSEDGGLFLETVLAFSRDFVADLEQAPRAARA
ncbi:BLUF domain-containing protein [Hoeflea sp. AS60]|uniref:BLUF domain-containing protein n=1 Tax=Hoeflea sp. AS60 TaxID=3135780 RepID=UPI00317AE075